MAGSVIQGENYRISVLTESLVRLEYSEDGVFEDGQTQVVQNRDFGPVACEVVETEEVLDLHTEHLHLHFEKGPFTPDRLFIELKGQYAVYGSRWHYGDQPETLKGTSRTLDEVDGAMELEDGILSKAGYALLDDSNSYLYDVESGFRARSYPEVDLYFFGYGRDYLGALKDFYHLTGQPPLLPRYALGNWWSRYWPYTSQEYTDLMDRFKAEGVPLAVSVIDMDWHKTAIPARFGSGWTGYSWNRDLIPDPAAFLHGLHERGLKVTLNVHPADGIRAFEDAYPMVAKRLGLDAEKEEAASFDFYSPAFREAYFEDVHHPLENQGVDFWWIDWQQGSHGKMDPLWLLNHYHYLDNCRKGQAGLILSRYGGPGSHRYPIGFSGDTIVTWESLAFQPYFTSTASNIGYTWWSHDIGGHMRGYYDEDLALRWLQFGVFSPINRLHSSCNAFNSKEPWFYSPETCRLMKQYLRLRHGLLPYLYTMNVATHEEGLPLVQPLYYHYPNEEEAYEAKNQYFFGSELMVAPITEALDPVFHSASVSVWFPDGVWYDFFHDWKYEGRGKLTVFRTSQDIPVFARAGAIIPMDAQPQTGVDLPEMLDWHLFPGDNRSFVLVEGEGDNRVETRLTVNWDERKIKLDLTGDRTLLPEKRQHRFFLHTLETTPILVDNHSQEIAMGELQSRPTAKEDRMFEFLKSANLAYDRKNELFAACSTAKDWKQLMKIITPLEEGLRQRLFEVIYSSEENEDL